MKKFMEVMSRIAGICAAAFGLFLLYALFSGDADDAVEVLKENRKEAAEENQRKEKTKTPKPNDDENIGSDYGSFVEYSYGDNTVLVPLYISEYVMDSLSADEQQSLLSSIISYSSIEDVDELMGAAYPASIPENANVREIAREGFVGFAYMFDAKVGYISGIDSTFAAGIVGDNSIAGVNIDTSFIDSLRLMQNDVYTTIAIYAGLDNGTPVFIALNMELQ